MVTSCVSQQERAMKSADKDYILKVANENFAKKKWKNALALYDRLANLVAGTDDFPNVGFNTAYANYYDKSYKLAGHQFKNFAVNFPKDPRAEEAAYMSALCYYEGSMDYNLDQSSTELAINELQDFLTNYPNSERSKNITQLIDELSYKLEFKAYENARQYFKMGDYKAANVALENVLEDFPGTKLRAKIYDYIMKSRYELAIKSVYDLKDERIESALTYTRLIEKELPNTDYAKSALEMRAKLEKEKTEFCGC
ncbi:outer membrane protein assembly factor BamD [Chryseobacterium sp. P1-3]|uniref:outer membrane protein assembly factor BamD n=1 Tax=Chryseobacterium sp. (strain P1-3) TaxID=1517683 RepID=UPI001EE691E3|nr:outer membrane protein assembly factor BamD [Chryseobacterium sp. P1-3]